MSGLTEARVAARRWLFDKALPLWATTGVDGDGSFHETLDFAARPHRNAVRRMRVTARQIHVFSEARVLGWAGPAERLVRDGLGALIARCWASDCRPGWIHLNAPDGSVLHPGRDAYDHAFALFALAWAWRATADPRAAEYGRRTWDYLDAVLADPVRGGVFEGDPRKSPRRSNPQMHLLEAALAWYDATGEREYLDRADDLVRLFLDRLFEPATGTLGEFFSDDWSPLPDARGAMVEPGHHFEWAWLLCWAADRGATDATAEAERLYDVAIATGLDSRGYAVDETDRFGRVTRATRRLWPQTELVKAGLAMARLGRPAEAERAAACALRLFEDYLATDVPGLWHDQYDADGRMIARDVPASTFYHLMVAFRELLGTN